MPANRWLSLAAGMAFTDSFIQAVRRSMSVPDLAALMADVTRDMGFRYYALIHHADLRIAAGRVDIKHYPESVSARIITQGRYRRDPVIRACAFAAAAFSWSELNDIIALDRHDRHCLEAGAAAGLNAGITVPSPLLGDYMGSCTFAGTRAPEHVPRLLGPAQMIGTFAFQAARRLVIGMPAPAVPLRLHPRQRECVILAGRGLSNKAIARCLALTPRTVDGYMTAAREILGAHSRADLVVSAIFAGEIDVGELRPSRCSGLGI